MFLQKKKNKLIFKDYRPVKKKNCVNHYKLVH